MRRRLLLPSIGVLLIAAGLGLWRWSLARPQLTEEQRLYLLVTQAQEAAHKHNAAALSRLLSDSYRDTHGYDKHQMTALIVRWLRGGEPFTVIPEVTALSVQGATASMQLKVRYFASDPNASPGEEFRMTLALQKEGRNWRITNASGWADAESDIMSGE